MILRLQSFVIVTLLFYSFTYAKVSNVINLPNGKSLKGLYQKSFHSQKDYVEFRGLRYATQPLGELRFKPTKPLDDIWKVLEEDATTYGSICPQLDPWHVPNEEEGESWDELKVLGDEDCLFANVATTDTNPENLLSVLVWIHPGNFQSESGQDYGVSKFMDHDIVVVTFNYRIGALGFLNSEDGIYNGNQGLKDQRILLDWVKKCIHLFGGDPNKITLAGSNAGGVSVHLHMLSHLSQGLFSRAIIQSGTAISPWVLMDNPKERMMKLAKHLKCLNDTDIGACIAKKDAVEIVQKTPKMAEWFLDPMVPFGPSIETHGEVEERFLAKNPFSILAEGRYWARDLQVIMGVNSHEGLLYSMDIGHQGMLRMVFNMEWFGAAPVSLYYKKSAVDPRSVSEAVREYYFPLNDEAKVNGSAKLVDKSFHFHNLTNLYSDRHFFIPIHHSAKLMGRSNVLYLYWFDHIPQQSIHGLYGYNSSLIFGPSHYDQLQYLFVTPFFNQTTDDKETVKFEKYFLHGLCTFLKEGYPFSKSWKKITTSMAEGRDPLIYNRIGDSAKPIHIQEPFYERVAFWKELLIMEYDRIDFINELEEEQKSAAQQRVEL